VKFVPLYQRISEEQSGNSFIMGLMIRKALQIRIMLIRKNGQGEAPAGARIDVKDNIS
jgi:hypothetical protein